MQVTWVRAIALHTDYLIGQRGACTSNPFRAYQRGELSLRSLRDGFGLRTVVLLSRNNGDGLTILAEK